MTKIEIAQGGGMFTYYLISPGERPYFASVAYHLWGRECDFDSDGNDDEALAGGWTELTVALRPDCEERVDVDPLDQHEPLVLVIRSERDHLAQATASFLQAYCGGTFADNPPR
ncbi:hypothetical protein [Sphingobium sp. YR768]|uniref:hypothetical protein n=1 Tax=Sphingobium sp. YR768 TaxID=1884365 RepID=UPI0008B55385|nr:hypothetical protein [Sphingobium sp. YR768]SEQ48947.1 hypothetical protein SAMN05518866_10198 [Sphingobium sp. YR768]